MAFIDRGIADWRTLAAGVKPGVETVLLDAGEDGLARMAAWARTRQGYDAIHVFSHGSAGTLILGALVLDAVTAGARAADLATLGAALGDDGDLLLYGCEVAKGETGAAFVDRLAGLTGAAVAASVDLTGNEAFGGTWALAYPGRPDDLGPFPLVPAQVSAFQGTLADASFTFDGGTGEVSRFDGPDTDDILWTQDGYTLKIKFGADIINDGVGEVLPLGYGLPSARLALQLLNYTSATITLTFSLVDGSFFTLNSIDLSNAEGLPSANEGDDLGYVLSASGRSDITGAVYHSDTGGASQYQTISAPGMNFITSFQITLADADNIAALLDNIIFSNIVRANAPVMTGIAGTVAITEDVASSLHSIFAGASFTDSDSASVSFTITASAGTLTAGSGSGVTVSGTGTGTLTLAGSPGDIRTFLQTDGTVTYLQATPDESGTNKATLTLSSADDEGSVALGSVQVNITAVNDAPVLTSDGGGATASVTVAENTTAVTTVVATDVDGDTITYSIDGGADAALFSIDGSTGALTFKAAPDFESPADSDADNSYAVVVKASDGTVSDTQTVNVTVTDVTEAPTLTATAANPTFTEGGSAVALFTGATASAVDAGQTITGFTLTVSNVASGDVLRIGGADCGLDGDGIWSVGGGTNNAAVVFTGGTATMTITGLSLSATDFQTLITDARFSCSSDSPEATARTVTITGLTDSGASNNSTSLALASTVSVLSQPDVTSVTLPADSTYKIGDSLNFTVTFDQAVTVDTSGGTPRLVLDVGGETRYATFVSGDGSTTLVFSYTVDSGDTDADGIAVSATSIDLNGGTLTGTTGSVNADLDLGTPGSLANVKVDGVAPTITGVSIPDQTHKIGDTVTVTITAGEAGLSLHGGSVNGIALTDFADKGGGTYTATYTVAEGNADRAAGEDIPVEIVLKDAAGNISNSWTTPISQSNDAIDATAPAAPTLGFTDTGVSDSDGITTDTTLEIGNLEAGATWQYRLDDKASWVDGTGTTLTLAEGEYRNSTAVAVRQIDAAGNQGDIRTLTITVDTTTPIITTGRDTPADPLTNLDELIYTLSFDEDVVNFDLTDLEMLGTNGNPGAVTLDLTQIDPRNYTVKVSGGNIANYNGDLYLSVAQAHDITDVAGNKLQIGAGNFVEYTLDNTAPATPTLALSVDTGSSASDLVTSNGTVSVSGLEDGTVREYSLDAGKTWTPFNGSEISLSGDGAKAVIVRQTDEAGNVSAGSTPLSFTLDTTAATVTSVAVPSNAAYKAGDDLIFTVNVGEDVVVTGTPRLGLTIGSSTVHASYDAASSTATALKFIYTVQAGDLDADGVTVGALDLNGGSIGDAAGNALTLTLNSVGATGGVLVDAVAPTLVSSTPADDAGYVALDSTITLTFSETIFINDGAKSIHIYSKGALVESFVLSTPAGGAPGDGGFQISGNTLILNPSAPFDGDTTYSVRIDAGALKDAGGNLLAGITDDTTLNFKTLDPASLVTDAAGFDTTTGSHILNSVSATAGNETIIVAAPSHLAGSTLDGGAGKDTVRLGAGKGSSFDLTAAATVAGVETLVVDSAHAGPVTVTLSSAKGLNSLTTLTGTGDDALVLAGGGTAETFDLSAAALSGFSAVQMSGAALTGYTLRLDATQITDIQAPGMIGAVTGSAGSNDTLVLAGSGYVTLTAQGLVLSGIETVSFDNDALSRTVVIDQALNLAFGLSGTNSVSTAVAALDLSGKSLTGVDALVSTSDTGTAFRLAESQIGSGKVTSVSGGSGASDSLRVDGDAVDFSSLTPVGHRDPVQPAGGRRHRRHRHRPGRPHRHQRRGRLDQQQRQL
ncbi:DUF4347 domain-containing protein [Rhodospirillum centenum]|uniref:DUF4347 domain-containing protein n=1 Tax=Rhodospirillum centenum TaxID=34018 RepID=UPI000304A3C0|nr:DUF4347 domain-containing protein [Rhodospirillum centenum]